MKAEREAILADVQEEINHREKQQEQFHQIKSKEAQNKQTKKIKPKNKGNQKRKDQTSTQGEER